MKLDPDVASIIRSTAQATKPKRYKGVLGRFEDDPIDASGTTLENGTYWVRVDGVDDFTYAYGDPAFLNSNALSINMPVDLERRNGKWFIVGTDGNEISSYYSSGVPGNYFFVRANGGTQQQLDVGETLDFADGTGIDLSLSSTTLTVSIDSTVVTLTGSQTLTNKTLTTPTIASFANATHNHQDAAGGGQLNATSVFSAGTVPVARLPVLVGADGVNAGTAGLAPQPAATDNTKYLRGDATWQTIATGMTSFTLAGDSGSSQTISDGNTASILGGTGIDTVASATDTITVSIDSSVVTLTGSQTLTNKTLTSPSISGGTIDNAIIGSGTAAGGGFTTLSSSPDNLTEIRTSNGLMFLTYASSSAIGFDLIGRKSRGTIAIPTAAQSGDEMLEIAGYGYGTSFQKSTFIRMLTTEIHGTSARGGKIEIYTTPTGSTTNTLALTIGSDQSLTVASGLTVSAGSISFPSGSLNVSALTGTLLTLAGDSGSSQAITVGNTATIAGGTGIDTVASATDTVTVSIDSTVATLTGSQTLTNKVVNLVASTVSAASLNIPSGTAPTSPVNGDIWTDGRLVTRQAGLTLYPTETMMTQHSAVTVANNAAETPLLSASVGTVTLPSNFLTQGKIIRLTAAGIYGTNSTNTAFTLRFKIGSVELIAGAYTLDASQTNQTWAVTAWFAVVTTGATGSVQPASNGVFTMPTGMRNFRATGTIGSIDMTGTLDVSLTADWTTANSNNTWTCQSAMIEVLG